MMLRRYLRACALLTVIVAIAPTGARATSDTLTAPYKNVFIDYWADPGSAGRSSASAFANGSKTGAVRLEASIDGKLGQSVVFADTNYASASVDLYADHTVPAGTRAVDYTVHLRVNELSVKGTRLLDPTATGARVWIYADAECFYCNGYGRSLEFESNRSDVSLVNEDIELPLRVTPWASEDETLEGTMPLVVAFNIDIQGGLRKGSWSATINAEVTKIEATY